MNARAELLANMPRGFADATHDAQAVFRAVLDALSRPGRLQTLAASDGLQAPAPLSRGLTALLLTLLDAETSLHLDGPLASDAAWLYARFHTGVQPAAREVADFVAARAADASLEGLRLGTDEAPQHGATLIVDAPTLAGQSLVLSGPGIEHTQRIGLCGLSAEFWQQRIAQEKHFPRGVDLLIVCGSQLIAVPRSTHIEMEAH
ncbi:phosphonate C-P lyase system protein PhnH [Piscinibacter gummiphilus]|uniref:Phosphonate C-P lyase system protein PhnH n=1 Tax=Piscinibacter gummiphilus TaxID=946333 RepID=A0ABZ0CUG5_9BURK|nr:phosphonate C-P lyase system protein PhnH [Piscinibacter gummiphilus]WOB08599.1 phosphonate C-P lyase system protein PhnH [Piscinibacter gummiphilus]